MRSPATIFRPDPRDWDDDAITTGLSGEGYLPGGSVSVHCARGQGRIHVTTSTESAHASANDLPADVLRGFLHRGGILPVIVDSISTPLRVDAAEITFSGARCGEEWTVEALILGAWVTVGAVSVRPEDVRLIRWAPDVPM